MNYYYELNKLVRFYEGIQAFQKNAEKFLSKSNIFDNSVHYIEYNDCGDNKNDDANIELRLNLLKSYYINGNFAAIKAHLAHFEKTSNIHEFIKKFKLSSTHMLDIFLKKIMVQYYSVIIIGNEYLSAYDKSAITKQILIYLEIFNTVNSLKDLINTTINEKEINNKDIANITTDGKEININNDEIKYNNCREPDYLNYTYKYNYTPLFFDLCKYLYEFKEYEKLTFFYNMLNFSKKIYNNFKNSYTEEIYGGAAPEKSSVRSASETFKEFDKINGNFDKIRVEENNASYNNINSKFFDILNMWESRTKNYYTKDEIFFSAAMFITNEYVPVLSEFYNYAGNNSNGGLNSENHNYVHEFYGNHSREDGIYDDKGVKYSSCHIKNSSGENNRKFINRNPVYYNVDYLNGNIYTGDNIAGVIKANYSNALKLFKKAIALNSYNPDYYYNYAECLKKSGRAKDAEIFFKKAFESAL